MASVLTTFNFTLGLIMMTNCHSNSDVLKTILGIGFIVLLHGIGQSTPLEAQTTQTPYTETPDPYFQNTQTPRVSSNYSAGASIKPTRMPTPQTPADQSEPSLWMTPKTITNPHVARVHSTPQPNSSAESSVWQVPSTNVTVPKPNMAPLQPFKSSNSIIRESGQVAQNNFPLNPTLMPVVEASPTTQPKTTQIPSGRDFQVVSPKLGQLDSSNTQPKQGSTNNTGSIFNDSNAFGKKYSKKQSPGAGENKINKVSYNRPLKQPSKKSPPRQPATSSKVIGGEEFQTFEPGKVLALVGGEPIFVGDLLFEINQVIEQYISEAPEDIKAKRRQEMIPQVLPRFVEAKILYLGSLQELPSGADVKSVLKQAEDEFDATQLDKVLKNSGLKSINEFDAYLRVQGSSIRKLRRSWAQEQLTKYFLSRALSVDTEVTHQEMLDSYHENIDSYAQPAKARWEQIMVRFDRSSSQAEARKKLAELGDQVIYGASFSAVSKKESHGFLASQGGQHDWTTKGALVLSEIDNAIFSLPIGDLSDIIESRDGYHIIRVLERSEAMTKPFLDAQVEIKKRILDEKRKKAFDEHIKKLKREIPVEYYLNDDVKLPGI